MECARVLVATSTFAGILLGAATAEAQADGLRLSWTAPNGCPSSDEVKSATLRGVDREKMLPGTLQADATVEQVGPTSWRVRLKTRRGSDSVGEREIEGPTCAGVADATAVVLALALVPPTTLKPEPPEPTRAPAPAPPSAPPKPEAPRTRHRVAVGASVTGMLGAMPKFGTGAAVHAAWTPGPLRVEAEGQLLFVSQIASVPGGSAGAEFALKTVGARGCYSLIASSWVDVAPCLGMNVNVMSADGRRADATRNVTEVWPGFSGGALGRLFLANWLAIRARVEGIVAAPPEFIVLGQGQVFRPTTVGAAGYFGAEVLFL